MQHSRGQYCLAFYVLLSLFYVVNGSPPYQYVGCYWSTGQTRIHETYYNIGVTANSMWILAGCINACEEKEHKYMAIRAVQEIPGQTYYCTCGDVDPSSEPLIIEAPAGSCPIMCPSATEYHCGALDHYVSLYKTGFPTAPSSEAKVTSGVHITSPPTSTEASDNTDHTSIAGFTKPPDNDEANTNTYTMENIRMNSAAPQNDTSNTGLIAGLVIFSILLVMLCVLAFCMIRWDVWGKLRDRWTSPTCELQNVTIVNNPIYDTNALQPMPAPLHQEDGTTLLPLIQLVPATYTRNSDKKDIYDNIYVNQTIRQKIKTDRLADHIAEMKKSKNPFKEEYKSLPSGKMAASELGERKSLLRVKNRFKNIVAYDHSRVVLEEQNDDPLSIYINANYIDGYSKEREYIATQGPMPNTSQDLWRMIWEQNVSIIVMLTNLKEGKKIKCEKYWPSKSVTKTYSKLRVTTEKEEIWPYYTIRTMTVKMGTESRIVRQYHFTSWPDHGVPQHASPLLALRRKVRKEMAKSQGPTVLHCSAGVGRTGTYLALDYLLQQAEAEGLVDVSTCVTLLRTNRINMIQTLAQYVFVYDGLLEALTLGETTIPCFQFQDIYNSMQKPEGTSTENQISKQYMMLEKYKTQMKKFYMIGEKGDNRAKNRDMSVIPSEMGRPRMARLAGGTDYINAVYVKGYRKDKAFIVTQKPLTNTKDDLWRMIYELKCPAIVSFNDVIETEEVRYWPDKGENEVTGHMKVSTEEEDQSQPGTHYTLKLEKAQPSESDVAVKVHLFHLTWSVASGDDLGPSSDLISIHSSVQRVQQQSSQSGPVVVQCLLGTAKSGIFCAVSSLINMINTEQEVDVFHIVKQIRQNRPQLINTEEEFGYLYKVVKLYLETFENYSNFNLLDKNDIRK